MCKTYLIGRLTLSRTSCFKTVKVLGITLAVKPHCETSPGARLGAVSLRSGSKQYRRDSKQRMTNSISGSAPSQAELILRAVTESMPDIVFVKDFQGRYILANEAAASWLHTTVEAMMGKDDQAIFPPQIAQQIQADDQRVLHSGQSVTYEEDIVQSGQVRSLLTTKFIWRDAGGQPLGVAGICRDITERKQATTALRHSEALNQAILFALPDLIIRMRADGTYLDVKAGNFPLTQASAEMVGENVRDILSPAVADRRMAAAAKALETGEMQRYEFQLEIDEHTRWRAVRIVPLGGGEVLVNIRDFSDLRQAEAALSRALYEEQAARQEAERANQVKDEFLAVLSHELRTPLNPILGWATLLRRGALSAEKIEMAAETIERNAKLQTQLIDDLLDIARMLRGKLDLAVKPVDLKVTVTQALETVRLAAQSKSLQIETQLVDGLMVQGDPTRLQQIDWNLLSNAVKFTPAQGQITIRLTAIGDQACLQVSDTGVGIQPKFLPYVYERFRQEDSTLTRQFGGLGLGLAIVRQLSELHGGTVGVESLGENQGATFTVQLPLMKLSCPC